MIRAIFVVFALAITPTLSADVFAPNACPMFSSTEEVSHGGGLNSCGCHIEHRTGLCHCHRAPACGC